MKLRSILHNWPDAEAITILRNIRNAMKPNSRVLILQDPGVGFNRFSVAPQPMLPNFGAGSHRVYQLDMAMWFIFNAKERTLDEFKTLEQVFLLFPNSSESLRTDAKNEVANISFVKLVALLVLVGVLDESPGE
ncbi:hypothetical protein K503DRAFT_782506 [Rhizopogon vinicolor AM-OR11-026]|uniref:O-methyltransferase C-terminal domain-containing protein n=1 Tax=Rhizopogon vinicolor AM-OR11-026 TaxID=1314800 RepID=A0A1B7N275_9AGAM|nr:hypothetical protein K503DRAFT_782506 [Rhizopogon vinicolor AM-OR11-026]